MAESVSLYQKRRYLIRNEKCAVVIYQGMAQRRGEQLKISSRAAAFAEV